MGADQGTRPAGGGVMIDVDPVKLLGLKRAGLGLEAYKRLLRHDPCAYCGMPFDERYPHEIDHIVPRSQGGPNHWSNYIGACGGCNICKLDWSMLTWLLRLERIAHRDLDGALAIRIGGVS
jgi:hypothetical protein